MKTLLKISTIVIGMTALGLTVQSQSNGTKTKPGQAGVRESKESKSPSSQFVQGVITIKLKEGVGDFAKQTGTVHFGIKSLDDKVANFEVYQLEKRFRYNPAKLRADLPDLSRIYKISFPETIQLGEVVKAFSSDPNVEYAEAIPVYHTSEVPVDALYSQCQHLPQIHAPEAWEIHKGENGTEEIVIAIVDTGVDWEHEDLQSNIWQNLAEDADGDGHTMEYNGTQWVLDPGDLNGIDEDANGFTDDLAGWNFITSNGDPNPIPGNPVGGHGTHCAGIAAGSTNNGIGIASISWNLKVMAICTDQNNTVPFGWDGIIYAAENGADIISNSWGGFPYSIADQEAVTYATGLGSIVLAAAGNSNNSALFYPADYQNVISVASVSVDDTKASYSCYNAAVDISAPGGGSEGGILSTIPGNSYEAWSGTSMATPLVAGCFGLLKSYHPDLTNEQLITQVLGTADNIDAINPGYEYMLGSGRVNAFRMLTEENVILPQVLKLGLASISYVDANGNQINEPGEEVTLNMEFYNSVPLLGDDDVTVTMTTEDPEITILVGTCIVDIPPDGFFTFDEPFLIQVNADASSHFAELTIHFESELPIVIGQDITITVLVAPSGTFVYEGVANGQDYSGTYIAGILDQLGYEYTYSNSLHSLLGFETVFLSFGNYESGATFMDNEIANAVIAYLEAGGNLYLEGNDALGYDQAANTQLLNLFGLESATDGSTNPINSLAGQPFTLTTDMLFTGNNQVSNSYIDKYVPTADAFATFIESGYGIVAVQEGTPNRRTFCFSYALAKLNDGELPNTREELLHRILNFFDIYTSTPAAEETNTISCNIYPNPMSKNAVIQYYLPEDSKVTIEIFNSIGQKIMQSLNGIQLKGRHDLNWDAEVLHEGVYYCRLSAGTQIMMQKIIKVK